MPLWTLHSSNLKGIDYLDEGGLLFVHFLKGQVWEYSGVPRSVYLAFRDAPSAGKFYAAEIKGKYTGRLVDPAPAP